jgi:transcriptional regulator with XRE-family HTH domain
MEVESPTEAQESSQDAGTVFGKNLRRARMRLGLSQEEVALACGLHRTEVSLLERGEREPRLETAALLGDLLGSTLDELRQGLRFDLPSIEEVRVKQAVKRALQHERQSEAQREAQRIAQPLRRQREKRERELAA